MREDNKNIKMLKNKLQKRKMSTEAEIAMFKENQMIEEITLLEEIQKNKTRGQEVQKELEKENGQAWKDNKVLYMEENFYIPSNQKI